MRRGAAASATARVTVAVDSESTIDAAARAGVPEVVIDVNVGLPRCGCAPDDAGRLADLARARGLGVRGVMGYEGHCDADGPRAQRAAVAAAMSSCSLRMPTSAAAWSRRAGPGPGT